MGEFMAQVVMYTTSWCPYCRAAKSFFASKKVDFTEISGRRTVPQIFIGGKPIGGYDDALSLDASGELEELLNGAPGTS
jgi:glutaredoxin 3